MNRNSALERSRFFSTRKFTTGARLRGDSSHQSMTARETPETMAHRKITGSLNQSFCWPSSNKYWRHESPTASRRIPKKSTGPVRRFISGGSFRKDITRNADTMPMGTLMKKHQFQV